MKRFIEGVERGQSTLCPECLEDWVDEENPVRVIDVFVDELDLSGLGFDRAEPEATGRPGYHPLVLLKLYVYGYLNRVQSSRRLEREAGRNVEFVLDRDDTTAFAGAVEFGHDQSGQVGGFVELLGLLHGVASGGRVDHQDDLVR